MNKYGMLIKHLNTINAICVKIDLQLSLYHIAKPYYTQKYAIAFKFSNLLQNMHLSQHYATNERNVGQGEKKSTSVF